MSFELARACSRAGSEHRHQNVLNQHSAAYTVLCCICHVFTRLSPSMFEHAVNFKSWRSDLCRKVRPIGYYVLLGTVYSNIGTAGDPPLSFELTPRGLG